MLEKSLRLVFFLEVGEMEREANMVPGANLRSSGLGFHRRLNGTI